MCSREELIDQFLTAHGWSQAAREPLAGDMSARRYVRLVRGEDRAVLMDADEPADAFWRMTLWLRSHGLSAPNIIGHRCENGLLLLEDFGDLPVSRLIVERPEKADDVFAACVDLLLFLRQQPPPNLEQPDAGVLVDWTDLVDTHYPNVDPRGLNAFRQILGTQLSKALQSKHSVSLRDFHTDNLMWLPGREGFNRLGLLDYQDAFLTHPCYDLVSLLTDARIPISKSRRDKFIALYLSKSGDDPEAFAAAFAAFSAQRNLRILGVFARAKRHLSRLPLVHSYFREALDHPMFANVRDDVLAALGPIEDQK